MIPASNYEVIAKHIYQGIDKIHIQAQMRVKNIDLSKVHFKNGYYKITHLDMFVSEKLKKYGEISK